jgi:hypothetical protein
LWARAGGTLDRRDAAAVRPLAAVHARVARAARVSAALAVQRAAVGAVTQTKRVVRELMVRVLPVLPSAARRHGHDAETQQSRDLLSLHAAATNARRQAQATPPPGRGNEARARGQAADRVQAGEPPPHRFSYASPYRTNDTPTSLCQVGGRAACPRPARGRARASPVGRAAAPAAKPAAVAGKPSSSDAVLGHPRVPHGARRVPRERHRGATRLVHAAAERALGDEVVREGEQSRAVRRRPLPGQQQPLPLQLRLRPKQRHQRAPWPAPAGVGRRRGGRNGRRAAALAERR